MAIFPFFVRVVSQPRSALIALLCAAAPAAAQDAFPLANDASVRALVEETLARNPELVAARERTTAAVTRVGRVAALPDPMVSVGYEKGDAWLPGSGADTGPKVGVSQAWPDAGKRRLLRESSERDADLSRHEIAALTTRLTYATRKAVADLLLARQKIAIIKDQRQATSDIEELTRARYSAGLATQLDVLRAQAELARFDQMRLHEEGLVASAIAELNSLRSRPEGAEVDLGARLQDLVGRSVEPGDLREGLARANADSPELRAAVTLVERSSLAVDLARRNSKPDFVFSGSYAFRGSLPDRLAVEVGISLPGYRRDKQRRAIAEAEAELKATRADREAAHLRARVAVEKAYADFKAAVTEARTIEREVLVIDALAVESALAGFRSGQTPFIAVLEAHSVLYKDRLQHAELLFHILWHSALLDAFGMERRPS